MKNEEKSFISSTCSSNGSKPCRLPADLLHPALQQLLAAQQKAVKQQERLQQTLLERTAWLLLHHLCTVYGPIQI